MTLESFTGFFHEIVFREKRLGFVCGAEILF